MITRKHVRRWAAWLLLPVGVLGIIGYIASVFGARSWVIGNDQRITLGRGAIAFTWVTSDPAVYGVTTSMLPSDTTGSWRWLPRMSERNDQMFSAVQVGRMVVPYWMLIAIGAAAAYRLLPPGYPRGRCGECGYDISAVPVVEGKTVCPECGKFT